MVWDQFDPSYANKNHGGATFLRHSPRHPVYKISDTNPTKVLPPGKKQQTKTKKNTYAIRPILVGGFNPFEKY